MLKAVTLVRVYTHTHTHTHTGRTIKHILNRINIKNKDPSFFWGEGWEVRCGKYKNGYVAFSIIPPRTSHFPLLKMGLSLRTNAN